MAKEMDTRRGTAAVCIVALVAIAFVTLACSEVGSLIGEGVNPVGLLPQDTHSFTILDFNLILNGDAPESVQNGLGGLEKMLEGVGIFIDELEKTVHIFEQNYRFIANGNFNWDAIRDELEDQGYEHDTYRNYEVLKSYYSSDYVAFIKSDDILILGDEGWVKDIIRGIVRESGLMMHTGSSDVMNLLDKIGSGWQVSVSECNDDMFGLALMGCEIRGEALSRNKSLEIKSTIVFMFTKKWIASSQASHIAETYDKDIWHITSLVTDGNFVIIEATAHEDDVR